MIFIYESRNCHRLSILAEELDQKAAALHSFKSQSLRLSSLHRFKLGFMTSLNIACNWCRQSWFGHSYGWYRHKLWYSNVIFWILFIYIFEIKNICTAECNCPYFRNPRYNVHRVGLILCLIQVIRASGSVQVEVSKSDQ